MRAFQAKLVRLSMMTASIAAMTAMATPAVAQAAVRQFDIPSQPLSSALLEFSKQSDVMVVISPEAANGKRAPAVRGSLPVNEAIGRLLRGSGLRAVPNPRGGYRIERETASAPRATQSAAASPGTGEARTASSSGEGAYETEEIVVTAQKRDERLLDAPVPVSVLMPQNLVQNGQTRLQDYFTKVPGLSFAPVGDGNTPVIAIRGVTTGDLSNPSVGIVIDDISYGATVTPSVSPTAPDIDPGDIARIEVLRGPQGTLYGASSIGGLVKYVTVDPSTDRISGRLQGGISAVKYGGKLGHSFRGSVNIPVGDTLAVRASGFTVNEPGYVDNSLSGERDVNRRESDGGRVALLWRPSDDLSVKLSAIIQESNRRGPDDQDTALGANPRQNIVTDTGTYNRRTQAYSATINGKLGPAELTSLTGYSVDKIDVSNDYSGFFGTPALGAVGASPRIAKKFSQEFRGSVQLTDGISWLFGGFYTDENSKGSVRYYYADRTTGADAGLLAFIELPSKFREYALFSSITAKFSDQFDMQIGGRQSWNKQSSLTTTGGPLFGGMTTTAPEIRSKDDVFTYLITPRFRPSDDMMIYGRIASGYRPGGPNSGCGIPGIPCSFDADTTVNYEVGVKGTAFDKVITYDLSLYYIDWKDIQLPLQIPGFGYQDNGSRAKSQGVELSLEARPSRGLTLTAWGAWNEAELTENLPANSTTVGRKGDRLPQSAKWSGNVSFDYEFPISEAISGSFGATATYVGDRLGIFRGATNREVYPSYTLLDFRAGLSLQSWTLSAYVNNVTNSRGLLRGGLDGPPGRPTVFTYVQPRTAGLLLTKAF